MTERCAACGHAANDHVSVLTDDDVETDCIALVNVELLQGVVQCPCHEFVEC